MIRQFGFTLDSNQLVTDGIRFIFCFSLSLQAQTAIKKFSLELKNESLPEALKQLEKAGGKNILFTYNGTESYRGPSASRERRNAKPSTFVLANLPSHRTGRVFRRAAEEVGQSHRQAGKVYDEKGAPCPLSTSSPLPPIPVPFAGSVTEDGSFPSAPR